MKNKAFTLAEVLITLVIIGVIAAITVPSIIQSTHKLEYVTKLKKVYSTLTQATDMIMFEEGNAKASTGGWAKDVDAVYEQYKKHLSLTKDCGSASGCLPHVYYKRFDDVHDSTNLWDEREDIRKIVLADGTLLSFHDTRYNCDGVGSGTNDYCSTIWVDLNGEQEPNKIGRDTFLFALKDDNLYPAGCDFRDGYCKKDNGFAFGGWGCACRVLKENAMNY